MKFCGKIRGLLLQGFCRPIKLLMAKETSEVTITEVTAIEQQINSLVPIQIPVNEYELNVIPTLIMTMIDGKICSTLTEESMQKCCLWSNTERYEQPISFM